MTTFVDTPLPHGYQAGLPSTPIPGEKDYLPSPPITPAYKRTAVKREKSIGSQPKSLAAAWDNPSHPTGSPVSTIQPPRGKLTPSKANSRITKPRSKTPATAKLSIRRKIAKSHSPPQRRTSFKSKTTTTGPPSPRSPKKDKSPTLKVKTESDITIINAHPFLQSTSPPGRPKASNSPPHPKSSKAPIRSKIAPILGKNRSRGRITNNSLSTTLHPIIAKRKGIRTRLPGPGKICSSYYPSDRKLVPHPAGERYHKGLPYISFPPPPNSVLFLYLYHLFGYSGILILLD